MAEDKCAGCKDAPGYGHTNYAEECFNCCRYYGDRYIASESKLAQLKSELAKRIKEMSENNYQ
jgi:hypothetical protein